MTFAAVWRIQHPPDAAAMGDTSDWEYEYAENETEDLYFTLDLTTRVPNAVPVHQVQRNGRRAPTEARSKPAEQLANGSQGAGVNGDAKDDALQILNLHTRQPLVQLNGETFSCRWHTDLGTHFYVAEPGTTAQPMRPGHAVVVIGTSQTRLLGQPVTLKRKEAVSGEQCTGNDGAAAAADSSDDVEQDIAAPKPSILSSLRPGQQLVVPREAIRNPTMAAQASFFEQLSAIKLKKGETDIIPVGAVKHYTAPANKEEMRERATGGMPVASSLAAPAHQSTRAADEAQAAKRARLDPGSGTAESSAQISAEPCAESWAPPEQAPAGSTVEYSLPGSFTAKGTHHDDAVANEACSTG